MAIINQNLLHNTQRLEASASTDRRVVLPKESLELLLSLVKTTNEGPESSLGVLVTNVERRRLRKAIEDNFRCW